MCLTALMKVYSSRELKRLLQSPLTREALSPAAGINYVCTDGPLEEMTAAQLPACPVVSLDTRDTTADIAAAEAELEPLVDGIDAQPDAAATLVHVLRHNRSLDCPGALAMESLAYSTLQHGCGFQQWLTGRPAPVEEDEDDAPVLTERSDNHLTLTLNRPSRHNAYSRAMRDALCAGLQLAHADTAIASVTLRGNGPSFCAGGDLREFGNATDAANAHVTRMTRSAGLLLAELPQAGSAELHGACIGAGIELPAFLGNVVARENTVFQLPEVAMGLIPGAGGTFSISRRIGRQRTAWMALTNARVDAATALSWGLVDAVSD